jgi:CRISPR system Cascade subunit CasC
VTLFIQLHALISYPPSNPNRDDLGRPKTATYGGVPRLRVSSQALKRAIRTHESFASALTGHLGERTQRLGEVILAHLREKGVAEARALEIAREVGGAFAKIKSDKDANPARTEQLAFVSPDERRFALELADRMAAGEAAPKDKDLKATVLRAADGAADIAMFGRMLADAPEFNREAAVQVSHALTTHRAQIEDDYYTAVDDLKRPSEDMGAGFVGEAGFGSGVFYVYACINRDLLVKNLAGDTALADRAIEAFVNGFALASPSGKKNSFANHVRAEFLLCERGDRQPRTLAGAFLRPVRADREADDLMTASINALEKQRAAFERVYGRDWSADAWMNARAEDMSGAFSERGVTLAEIAVFAARGA